MTVDPGFPHGDLRMRFRLWLNVLALLTITSVAFASGGEKLYVPPTPTGNGTPESSSSNNGILTPRQQAEHKYGDAYDGIAKAKEDAAAGKQKNADKRFKRALADCQEAVAIDSTYHEAWNLIGFASRKLGDYPHSLAAYRTALRLKPDFAPAREYYGEALLETNDLVGAKQQLALLTRYGAEDQAALLRAAIAKYESAHADTTSTAGKQGM